MAAASRLSWSERSAAFPAGGCGEEVMEDTAVLDRLREEDCTLPVSAPIVDRDLRWSEGIQQLDSTAQRLRSFDEDEQTTEESLFLEYEAVYILEEEGIQNQSDVNFEENNAISEAVHSMNRIKRMNTDLQKSLDVFEDCNSALRTENTSLKNQIRSLRQITQDDRHLKEELDAVRAAKLEQEQICSALEASKKQLEREIQTQKDQIEAISSEMSSAVAEKEMYKEKSEELSQLFMALEQEAMENRLHLDQINELIQEKDVSIKQLEDTIRDYRTIQKDLKEKIQDLEGQLALALVSGSGCTFMSIEHTLEADVQRPVSLREELGLLPHDQVENRSEEEENRDEEQQHRVEEDGKKTKENMDEDRDGDETVVEEASLLNCPVRFEAIRRGIHTAGVLSIGFLVPLGLLRALAPALCDCLGLSHADFIWVTLRRVFEPYCVVYHTGLPPV